MLKHVLCVAVILCGLAHAQTGTYTLHTATTTNAAEAAKVELTTTTGTLPVYLKLSFKYTFGTTAALADTAKDLTVCCVTTVTSTDPLASTYLNRCFASQVACAGGACAVGTPTNLKHALHAGLKHDGKFYRGVDLKAQAALAAADFNAAVVTIPDISLQRPLVAAIGLDTATSTDYTITCTHSQFAAGNTADPTAGAGYTIPTAAAAGVTVNTVAITKSGSYTCSTSSTSKSGAFVQSVVPIAILSALLALIAFD